MIKLVKHVLFFKLTEYSEEGCKALRDMFLSMQGKVPQVIKVDSHVDFLRSARSFDVMLEVDLESPKALEDYQSDPYHCDVVKTYVHSVVSQSVAIDYEF